MIAVGLRLGIPYTAASLNRLDQLLLGLGHVAGPVSREVLAKRLDVAGLVLPRKPLSWWKTRCDSAWSSSVASASRSWEAW